MKTSLALDNVSLVCIDTKTPELSIYALSRSMHGIDYGEVLFFVSANYVRPRDLPPKVKTIPVAINSNDDYNYFVLFDLIDHVSLDYVMIVQWDGFVINPERWVPQFLDYDFIGAPWRVSRSGRCLVGNGGFSIRSKKLMLTVQRLCPRPSGPLLEDEFICKRHRTTLESGGLKFATPTVGKHFSFESVGDPRCTFGFHGLQSLSGVCDSWHLELTIETMKPNVCRLDSFSGFFKGAFRKVSTSHAEMLLGLVEDFYFRLSDRERDSVPHRSLVKVLVGERLFDLSARLLKLRLNAEGLTKKNLMLIFFFYFYRLRF
jgi:hypothetical protein